MDYILFVSEYIQTLWSSNPSHDGEDLAVAESSSTHLAVAGESSTPLGPSALQTATGRAQDPATTKQNKSTDESTNDSTKLTVTGHATDPDPPPYQVHPVPQILKQDFFVLPTNSAPLVGLSPTKQGFQINLTLFSGHDSSSETALAKRLADSSAWCATIMIRTTCLTPFINNGIYITTENLCVYPSGRLASSKVGSTYDVSHNAPFYHQMHCIVDSKRINWIGMLIVTSFNRNAVLNFSFTQLSVGAVRAMEVRDLDDNKEVVYLWDAADSTQNMDNLFLPGKSGKGLWPWPRQQNRPALLMKKIRSCIDQNLCCHDSGGEPVFEARKSCPSMHQISDFWPTSEDERTSLL